MKLFKTFDKQARELGYKEATGVSLHGRTEGELFGDKTRREMNIKKIAEGLEIVARLYENLDNVHFHITRENSHLGDSYALHFYIPMKRGED